MQDRSARAEPAATPPPIAIVGVGALFPKSPSAGWFWANVKNGVDGITEVPPTHWNPADYFDADPKKPDSTYARRGGFLSPVEFNPIEWGLPPKDLEATDTSQLLGLVAAKMALDDAGIRFKDKANGTDSRGAVDRGRVSVILGVTGTLELVVPLGARLGHPHWRRAMKDAGIPDDAAQDAVERIADAYVPWQENSFPGLLGNVVAGRIANKLDLHGTNCVVDAACASSLSAVHLAMLELQTGKADVAVTGGADTFNDIFMFMCFSKTPALSPTGDAKPFDESGDGTILGEGLGMVVLKRLADAEAAGDRIYAVIRGLGTSSDGKGHAIYAPSAEGQKRCLHDAYQRAGIDPATVELVEAHGTGTKVGDATEAAALSEVYRNAPPSSVALGSVKSQIGHTKAAAGAASLIKAALALHNKVLPPTLKVTQPVEPLRAEHSPFYVNSAMCPWLPKPGHPRRAALSAFGFGGSNFHAVLEEYSQQKAAPDWDGSIEILALSAKTTEDLQRQLEAVPRTWDEFARAAEQSRSRFSHTAEFRLVLVAQRGQSRLEELIASARQKLAASADRSWSTPEGAHFGHGKPPGKLAVVFSGQGSQRVGMLRDLACLFPEMLEELAAAEAGTPRLAARIHPPTRFSPEARRADDEALRATDIAQPALGAVEIGAWRVLAERFGIKADAFAGHSYGELPALAAAGRISFADMHRLSRRRGELMAGPREGDPGSMLAVIAPLADVQAVLRDSQLNLVIANSNAPTQFVLSGPTLDIEKAVDAFRARSIRTVRLPVAAAFHSPLVADAAEPFRQFLDGITIQPGHTAAFCNSTAGPYPQEAGEVRELLGRQLARPVQYADEILAMAAAGVRTFLEVGPGTVLTKLNEAILSAQRSAHEYACIALDSAGGTAKSGVNDLATVLARLATLGYDVAFGAWEAGSLCRPAPPAARPGMSVPICGANYRAPHAPKPPKPPRPAEAFAMPAPADDAARQALTATQAALAALQQLQAQTAELHKQFLDSQELAQRTLAQLVSQQAALAGLPAIVAPMPPAAPAFTPQPVPTPSLTPTPAPIPIPASMPAMPPPSQLANGIAAAPPGDAALAATLIRVVAEKTGYPVEMLDLGMSLDADLGIDSIKRVEILSALQEIFPDAPTVKPEHLGSLQTLQDVANFLSSQGVSTIVEPAAAAQAAESIADILLAVVAEKTGYPREMLELDMALDADLGIDSIKRVEILSSLQEKLPDAPIVKPEQLGTLRTLRDVVDFLSGNSVSGPGTAKIPVAAVSAPAADAATMRPAPLSPSATPPLTEHVSSVMKARMVPEAAAPAANPPGDAAPKLPLLDDSMLERSIVQAVDVDQNHSRPRVPLAEGALLWLVAADEPLADELMNQLRSLQFRVERKEWDAVAMAEPPGELAGLILLAPAAVPADVPLNRYAFQWVQLAGPPLRTAARTTAACVVSISRLDGSFGLLGLTATADPASGGLAGLVKTVRHEWPEIAVKAIDLNPSHADSPAAAAAVLVEEVLAAGPIEVGISPTHRCTLELARTVRRTAGSGQAFGPTDVILVTGGGRGVTAEVAVALANAFKPTLILTGRTAAPSGSEPAWAAGLGDEAALKAAALTAMPQSKPKQIGEAVARVLAQREVQSTIRRIEAAGGKAAYFSVNVAQERAVAALLQQVATEHGPVTALVHGAGVLADRRIEHLTPEQFDYVYSTKVDGARHLLSHLSGTELKAVVLFGSTTGRLGRVGQAAYACANETLNKIAQVEARRRPNSRVVCINWGPWEGGMVTPALRKVFEAEGIGLIPLDAGAAFLIHELSATGRSVEVVALGARSRQTSSGSQSGILLPPVASAATAPAAPSSAGPAEMLLAFERTVDLASHPVLRSHVLDGRAVLPMAVHLEWLAHAALHGNPGLVFHGINDLRITHGVMVEEGSASTLRLFAGPTVKHDRNFHVPVELRGRRRDGRDVLHSRAEVVLTAALPKPPNADQAPIVQPYTHPMDELYKYFLFHGPDLQGIEGVDGLSDTAFIGRAYPAPQPAEWFAGPLRSAWVADPLALDASYQMMILWSFAQHGAGSLPCFLGRYRQFRRGFPAGPVRVVIRINRDDGRFARADIDYIDADGTVIARAQDYECVIDPGLNQAFRRNQLAAPVRLK